MPDAIIVSRSVAQDPGGRFYCRWCSTAGFQSAQAVRAHLKGCTQYQELGDEVEDPSELPDGFRTPPQPQTPSPPSPAPQPVYLSPQQQEAPPAPQTGHPGTSPMDVERCRRELLACRAENQALNQQLAWATNHRPHAQLDQALAPQKDGVLSKLSDAFIQLIPVVVLAAIGAWLARDDESARGKTGAKLLGDAMKEGLIRTRA